MFEFFKKLYRVFVLPPVPEPREWVKLIHIEPKSKLVFICSRFAGDIEKNIENAKAYMWSAIDAGVIPFAPHLLYPQIMDDNDPEMRDMAIRFSKVWIAVCDEVWAFGTLPSPGMIVELEEAERLGKTIHYFNGVS